MAIRRCEWRYSARLQDWIEAEAEAERIGKTYLLNYPPEFVTLPDYTAHAGQPVTILRELRDGEEYDFEGDRMYEVRASDGWTGHAWNSELADLP